MALHRRVPVADLHWNYRIPIESRIGRYSYWLALIRTKRRSRSTAPLSRKLGIPPLASIQPGELQEYEP